MSPSRRIPARVLGFILVCLMLWRSHLGPFIERHEQFGQLLKTAATTPSGHRT
jgi:hypothetical protein